MFGRGDVVYQVKTKATRKRGWPTSIG